jgi:predicted SprT family Zn-dependent metalloprotease
LRNFVQEKKRTTFNGEVQAMAKAASVVGQLKRVFAGRLSGEPEIQAKVKEPHHYACETFIDDWNTAYYMTDKAGWKGLMDHPVIVFRDGVKYLATYWEDDKVYINLDKVLDIHEDFVRVIVHEMGHRIWFRRLSRKQKRQWIDSWERMQETQYVTAYASTSPVEDFAEVFQEIICGKLDSFNRRRWNALSITKAWPYGRIARQVTKQVKLAAKG